MTTISKIAAVLGVVAGLGVAALPVSTFAADNSKDVTVSITISPTTGGDDSICEGNTGVSGSGGSGNQIGADCSIDISSNTPAKIMIRDTGGDLNLIGSDDPGFTDGVADTATGTGTYIAPIASQEPAIGAMTQMGWGFRYLISSAGAASGGLTIQGNFNRFSPITSSDQTVASSSAALNNATGDFTFAANTSATQNPDTYVNTVTITIAPAP